MVAQIIAFEGKRNSRLFVAWGTAAIRKGDRLLNSTRQVSSAFDNSDFQSLVAGGALTELPKAIEISDELAELPLVVLEIEAFEGFERELKVDGNRVTSVLEHVTAENRRYYVFGSHEIFRNVAATLITQFLQCLLYLDVWKDEHERLMRSAMALDAHHPVINALRASRSNNREAFLPIARSNLRSEEARSMFESAWRAFTNDDLRYVLKYKGGLVREEGGMPIGNVARLMRSIQSTRPVLTSTLLRRFPFLHKPPEQDLSELRAASAEFHFKVPGDAPLGERLARYVELELFEQSLAGELPEGTDTPQAFVEAVRRIAAPAEKTVVTQRLASETPRAVQIAARRNEEAAEEWSTPFTVLGYQSGLVKDSRQIEIIFFPGEELVVSSTDNGSGQAPLGLDFLRTSRDFLFRPALYTVQRRRHDGADRFFLQEVLVLKPGTNGTATAVHSSLVPHAFVCNLAIPVSRPTPARLLFGDAVVPGVDAKAVGDARAWMLQFAEVSRRVELSDSRHARLAPAVMPQPSFLLQVLTAVSELGGTADQADVVTKINERFSKSALVNNTRREVLRNRELLNIPEGSTSISITTEGRRYLSAFERIARKVR